jgi:hypothetical protein
VSPVFAASRRAIVFDVIPSSGALASATALGRVIIAARRATLESET